MNHSRVGSIEAITFLVAAFMTPVRAAEPTIAPLDLPPLTAVERALVAYPPIKAARDNIRLEASNEQRLRAGPYEFAINGGYMNHNIPNGRFPEWTIGLERPLRLPNKAQIDRTIATQNISLAKYEAYSAWCDGARLLLKMWFAWARDNVQLSLWERQVEFLKQQQSIVTRRANAGDAPRVEVNLANAALAQSEAVTENYRGRENGSRWALERTFAGLPVPARAVLGDPKPIEQDLQFYLTRVRDHNDEVRVAHALSDRTKLVSDRAAADRIPDPALGVRLATDKSTNDTITSIYVAIPIPGAARRSFARSSEIQYERVLNQEAAILQRVSSEVSLMYGQARGAYAAWTRARASAEGMRRNADSMSRSWQLKEASISDVLLAQRLAVESALTEAMAQIDAEESRYRLLVEAHLLWNDPMESE